MKMSIRKVSTVIAIVGSGWCGVAAADLDYEFRVGATKTDNVRRVSTLEEDQTVARAGFMVDWVGESARVEAAFQGDFDFLDYLDNAFDNEEFITSSLDATFKLSPETLHWTVENKYGKIRGDPFASNTAANRENVNSFSTGPDLTLRFGGKTSVIVSGRYDYNWYELSNADSRSLGGALSIVRTLSPNRSISVNASTDRVEFDNSILYSDFDRQSAFLGFNSRVSRGTVSASIGVNELHDNGTVSSGTLASLSWERKVTASSTFSIGYSQRFSDAGDIFSRYDSLGSSGNSSQDVVPIGDAFENKRFTFEYQYQKAGALFTFSGYSSSDEYQSVSPLDSRRIGGDLSISMNAGSGWELRGVFRSENRDFDIVGRDDDYLTVEVGIDRQVTRTLWLSLEYLYANLTSSQSGADYRENRYTFLVLFRPPS